MLVCFGGERYDDFFFGTVMEFLRLSRQELQSEISREYLSIRLLDLIVPEAVRSVIIHHSDSLHERVTYCWTDKPEASLA